MNYQLLILAITFVLGPLRFLTCMYPFHTKIEGVNRFFGFSGRKTEIVSNIIHLTSLIYQTYYWLQYIHK